MKELKNKFMDVMANFAKNMVQPLMYVAIVGIVMILGIVLTNARIVGMLPFLGWGPLPFIGKVIYNCLMYIINNLGVLLCVGIAGAMAKKYRHHAAIIALMSFFIFLNANNLTLAATEKLAQMSMFGLIGTGQATVFGIQVLDMGVFGGIIVGCVVGAVFNKTCDKTFKGYFQMFSGVRFPFLIMLPLSMILGWGACYVWPPIQTVISAITNFMANSGYVGLWLYGFLNKYLVPAGLHHLVYAPFQFSEMGGVLQLGETTLAGAYAIRTAEVAAGLPFSDSSYWMSFTFNNLFVYMGVAAAFIKTSYAKNKEKTKALLIPLTVTVLISSMTEPFDFLFCFAAPVLFFLLSVISGFSVVLLKAFNLPAATGGGIINVIISNLVAGYERTHWPFMILLGLIIAAFTYFLFAFLIEKFDMKTPGREEEVEEKVATTTSTNTTTTDRATTIVEGLGGKDNIVNVDCCFTRLRVTTNDISKVNEAVFKATGSSGVVKKGNEIQIIYGSNVTEVKAEVENYLK